MARKVAWTEAAWNDLSEIADHIAIDSPHYAATFVREARDAAQSLVEFAERGRVVPEFGDQSVRELFIKTYRMVYQVSASTVYVLGLIHGARLMPSSTRPK